MLSGRQFKLYISQGGGEEIPAPYIVFSNQFSYKDYM